jgi:hypothetical protein
MFGRLIKKFVQTAYISIIKDGDSCDVCVKVFKNKTELFSESKRFSMETKESSKLLYEFISHQYEKYKIIYTASIINSINQGGVPGCNKQNFQKYEIDTTNATVICIDQAWSIFASNYDIENTKKDYEELGGLDCLFSSIVILRRFFETELSSTPILCMLKQKTSATIAILTDKGLLFSSYVILKKESAHQESEKKQDDKIFGEEEGLDEERLVDLDDIALELHDNGEMDFAPVDETQDESSANMGIESLGSDLRILEFVKTALTQFYKNDMYEPIFIEKIAIADPYLESPDIKNLLENELMMAVEHKKIELCEITAGLAAEEVLG